MAIPNVADLPRRVVPLANEVRDALAEDMPLADRDLPLEPYQARWLVAQT